MVRTESKDHPDREAVLVPKGIGVEPDRPFRERMVSRGNRVFPDGEGEMVQQESEAEPEPQFLVRTVSKESKEFRGEGAEMG
ncbi:hypothetical protein R5W23_000138 [Gemmata sp. JC673]|uniref:Uncharacterized protein n=1 Tax=Gemmata algarum TaxID=2975278 RepID=A0ABU5ERB1_9BACT|nr:hypothetical protein [Gemmata algarum]MDY3557611.1 hypothetical protein [Gemmata algarum]